MAYLKMFQQILCCRMAHELGPKITGLNMMSASLVSCQVPDMQVQLFTICCAVHAFVKHDTYVITYIT